MYRDSDGLLWVGTLGEGLRLVDGNKTFSFSVLDGLFDDVIYGIIEDGQGRLWMACSKGIFSVSRADLRQFAAGTIKSFVSTPYSPLDGLRTVECQPGVQPAIARTKDGRLWFSTIRGVLVIDPEHFDRRLVPPAVIVEGVTVNGERRSAGDMGTLPAGLNNVDFKYTGASFIAPARITFRYTLQGLDKRGSRPDPGAKRSTPICRRDASGSGSRRARPTAPATKARAWSRSRSHPGSISTAGFFRCASWGSRSPAAPCINSASGA